MSQELFYTSAPTGLKPGSRGFCTVASTAGMAVPLVTALESLSAYRQVFPPGDSRAVLNPVVWSHVRLPAAGKTYSVLSRVSDYGLDYSQRTNKLAHHVALEPRERPAGGPAWALSQPDFLQSEWTGDPRILTAGRVIPNGDHSPALCSAWEQATGDAGWGGVLAESLLANPERQAYIIFEPGMDLLPLLIEAIALLPPERRWEATFNTYYTNVPPGVICQWRCVLADSPEAQQSRRFVQALRINLCEPLPVATGGALVACARTGLLPSAASQQPVTAIPPPLSTDWSDQDLLQELEGSTSQATHSTGITHPLASDTDYALDSQQYESRTAPPLPPPRGVAGATQANTTRKLNRRIVTLAVIVCCAVAGFVFNRNRIRNIDPSIPEIIGSNPHPQETSGVELAATKSAVNQQQTSTSKSSIETKVERPDLHPGPMLNSDPIGKKIETATVNHTKADPTSEKPPPKPNQELPTRPAVDISQHVTAPSPDGPQKTPPSESKINAQNPRPEISFVTLPKPGSDQVLLSSRTDSPNISLDGTMLVQPKSINNLFSTRLLKEDGSDYAKMLIDRQVNGKPESIAVIRVKTVESTQQLIIKIDPSADKSTISSLGCCAIYTPGSQLRSNCIVLHSNSSDSPEYDPKLRAWKFSLPCAHAAIAKSLKAKVSMSIGGARCAFENSDTTSEPLFLTKADAWGSYKDAIESGESLQKTLNTHNIEWKPSIPKSPLIIMSIKDEEGGRSLILFRYQNTLKARQAFNDESLLAVLDGIVAKCKGLGIIKTTYSTPNLITNDGAIRTIEKTAAEVRNKSDPQKVPQIDNAVALLKSVVPMIKAFNIALSRISTDFERCTVESASVEYLIPIGGSEGISIALINYYRKPSDLSASSERK